MYRIALSLLINKYVDSCDIPLFRGREGKVPNISTQNTKFCAAMAIQSIRLMPLSKICILREAFPTKKDMPHETFKVCRGTLSELGGSRKCSPALPSPISGLSPGLSPERQVHQQTNMRICTLPTKKAFKWCRSYINDILTAQPIMQVSK